MANSIKQLLALKARGQRITNFHESWQVVEDGTLKLGHIADVEERITLFDDQGTKVVLAEPLRPGIAHDFTSEHTLKLSVIYDVNDQGTATDEDDTGKPIVITRTCTAAKGCVPDWDKVTCRFDIGPGVVNTQQA